MRPHAGRLLPLALATAALAQAPLRTTVHLVIAPTTVTDAHGVSIDGLTAPDFRLWDDGQPRDVRVDFASVPISLVLAVERSFWSAAVLNKTRKIGGMFEPLVTGERGEVAVVAFDSAVSVEQEFTTDFEGVEKALKKIQPGDDGAKTVDAVAESVRLLARRPPERRRVLLLISETRDRGSKTRIEDAVTQAQQENVVIYPLSYSAYTTPFTAKAGTLPAPDHAMNGIEFGPILYEIAHLAKANAAEAFARYTGGERLSFTRQKILERAVERIGEDLHSQYLLSFTAAPDAGARFHSITVAVPGRPGAKVRTRPGYWMAETQP